MVLWVGYPSCYPTNSVKTLVETQTWLPRTGISSRTLRSVIEYGLPLPIYLSVCVCVKPRNTHTHTHPFNGPFPGLPRWAGTRKVKPIWILLKKETVSGSGISWAVCKYALHSRQIATLAPHRSVFYRPDALPADQPTASKHWRQESSM